jgi:hypothetical protein
MSKQRHTKRLIATVLAIAALAVTAPASGLATSNPGGGGGPVTELGQ